MTVIALGKGGRPQCDGVVLPWQRRFPVRLLLFLSTMLAAYQADSFVVAPVSQLTHSYTSKASPLFTTDKAEDPPSTWKWNATGSIAGLLMQLQRKEEELQQWNDTDALPLTEDARPSLLRRRRMNETARLEQELDNSVTKVSDPFEDVVLQPTPKPPRREIPELPWDPCKSQEIGENLLQLAVSMALQVETEEEWREYCQTNRDGIQPLIQLIRNASSSIRSQELKQEATFGTLHRKNDTNQGGLPAFKLSIRPHSTGIPSELVAFDACRALANLCSISPDMASVITDDFLRANTAHNGTTLMQDLLTLLRYTQDVGVPDAPSLWKRIRTRNQPRRQVQHNPWGLGMYRNVVRRQECKLSLLRLLLATAMASDHAIEAFRATNGLQEAILQCSSHTRVQRAWRRFHTFFRWLESTRRQWRIFVQRRTKKPRRQRRRALISKLWDNQQIKATANQILAAMGHNTWTPKMPGQKGLRILCLDGGGSRGMVSVMALKRLTKSLGGLEVSECFDMVVGTSTGAIITALLGLKRETSSQALKRYDKLIPAIFTKRALSTPLLLLTTASYDESPFMEILSDILGDQNMLESRADPAVPYVFAVACKMSATPNHVALFRNYNYNGGEPTDAFVVDPQEARKRLELSRDGSEEEAQSTDDPPSDKTPFTRPPLTGHEAGSRYPGSFRVSQKLAVRASTAAPTVFKPVHMAGDMYCDGGIVANNPTAIGIHEARSLFPQIPIECIVSVGTGHFLEQKGSSRFGWDGILGQIVYSACDGEQVHHILEDVLGDDGAARLGRSSSISGTRYFRFNPVLGYSEEYPIDLTDPEKLETIKGITKAYMDEPDQQQKVQDLADLLHGRRRGFRNWFRRW